ncbi:MAG: hypothetical protein ACK5MO_13970, partial [Planctomyces sp.]
RDLPSPHLTVLMAAAGKGVRLGVLVVCVLGLERPRYGEGVLRLTPAGISTAAPIENICLLCDVRPVGRDLALLLP